MNGMTSKTMLSSSSGKIMILVVMSFLSVILIYSSAAKFDVFARKPLNTCSDSTPTAPGAVTAKTCCTTTFDSSGHILSESCTKCQWDAAGNNIECINFYPKAGQTGPINPPPSVGPAQPSSTPPPPSNFIPPPSTSPLPSRQQTTAICPDGLVPDANGNCPPSSPNSTTKSQQLISNNQNRGNPGLNTGGIHHGHKGSSNPSPSISNDNTLSMPHHRHKG